MKKIFILISLLFIMIPHVVMPYKPMPPQEDDSEFDAFLEGLFGPEGADNELDEEDDESEYDSYEEVSPPKKAPSKADAKELSAEEKEKQKQKTKLDLTELKKLLGEITNAAQSFYFDPQFKDEVLKDIHGIEPVAPAPPPKGKGGTAPQAPIVYKDQGAHGLLSLIGVILDEKIYRETLLDKQYTGLRKQLSDLVNRMTDLDHDIDEFINKVGKVDEAEVLRQLRLPAEKRKITLKSPELQKEQSNLQKRVSALYKDLPKFTQELEKILNDKNAQNEIKKQIKSRENLEKAAKRGSGNYGSDYNRYGGSGGYNGGRGWDPGRGGSWDGGYDGGRGSDYFPGDGYSEDRDYRDSGRDGISDSSSREDDGKRKKDKSYSNGKKTDKDDKDKLKPNLITQMKTAVSLMEELFSPISKHTKKKNREAFINDDLKKVLDEKGDKIEKLQSLINDIESRKNKPEAKKSKDKKKTKDKWKEEQKLAEKTYYEAFERYAKEIVLLCKYPEIAYVEQKDGRRTCTLPENQDQKRLGEIYNKMIGAVPANIKKNIDDETKKLKDDLLNLVKSDLQAQLNVAPEPFKPEHRIVDLGAAPKALENTKNRLEAILRTILIAKKSPVAISIKAGDLGAGVQPALARLSKIEEYVKGRFSPLLQKHINAVQSHTSTVETTHERVETTIEELRKSLGLSAEGKNKIRVRYMNGQELTPAAADATDEMKAKRNEAKRELKELFEDKVTIGDKEYTIRKMTEYSTAAGALNKLDESKELIKLIRKEAGWTKPLARKPIEVIDALWCENIETEPETKITNPQRCTTHIFEMQKKIDELLETRTPGQTEEDVIRNLKDGYLLGRRGPGERGKLYLHYKIGRRSPPSRVEKKEVIDPLGAAAPVPGIPGAPIDDLIADIFADEDVPEEEAEEIPEEVEEAEEEVEEEEVAEEEEE